MRNVVAATLAATLFVTSALAATDLGPLPAGKPAGVKQAQDAMVDSTLWWIVGLGVIAAGIGVIASGNSNGALVAGTTTTTTTTTTAAAAAKGGSTTTTTT